MKDDIIKLAREAGIASWHKDLKRWVVEPGLKRFAELVRADEREACAKVCDEVLSTMFPARVSDCAAAIRARNTRPTSVIYSPGELAARGLTHEDVVKLIKENT